MVMDGVPVENVDKASKWTAFILVDLKIVFIITFVYVSVVNLISTTANNEATTDIHSNNTFTVSTQHTNVKVSFIDDAILWNCRDQSVTRRYYQTLYLMLIGSFSFALVTLTIVKWKILCSAEHSCIYLWRIAVVQCIWDKVGESTTAKAGNNEPTTDTAAKFYQVLVEEHKYDIPKEYTRCRLSTLFINSFILPIALFLCFTTYDLHPFSCIPRQEEKYIEYSRMKNAVEIQFPDWIKIYRKIAIAFIFLFGFIFLINTVCFHACNFKIIEKLKEKVKERIQNC